MVGRCRDGQQDWLPSHYPTFHARQASCLQVILSDVTRSQLGHLHLGDKLPCLSLLVSHFQLVYFIGAVGPTPLPGFFPPAALDLAGDGCVVWSP